MGMSYFIAFLEKILLKIDLLRYREVADGNLPRPARLPRRKRRVNVLSPIRAFAPLDMIADFIVLAILFVFGLRERVQIATRKI
jgi:hypothetical protein